MPILAYPALIKTIRERTAKIVTEVSSSFTRNEGTEHIISNSSHYIVQGGETPVLIAFQDSSKHIFSRYQFVLRLGYKHGDFEEVNDELLAKLTPTGIWQKHPDSAKLDQINPTPEEVIITWNNSFHFKESTESNTGLRRPQIGAVHALLAHWTYSQEPAIVVMPTGTGKTETMLSALISAQINRLVVVVPTDALREQVAGKFISLGWLKSFGIVDHSAFKPIVAVLDRIPILDEIDLLFEQCNVIVSTMAVFGRCEEGTQVRIAARASHLFIDEAHHTPADKWNNFKERFRNKSIVQFTATPFRNDDRKLEGRTVFNYPLRKAQQEGYFKPINFIPVSEHYPAKSDEVIARRAVERLEEDLANGLDHILMARVRDTARAKEVFEIYSTRYPHLKPIKIYSRLTGTELRDAKRRILNKEPRIIVCVDMLGEGFDMPELKIAAFHDIKKSLPITLQLAGRFTRSRADLGDATFIANIADNVVTEELELLYQHDSDWNLLLPNLAQNVNQEQEKFWDLIRNFEGGPTDYPIHQIKPALSTVIFKSAATTWHPDNFRKGLRGEDTYDIIKPIFNYEDNVLVVVLGRTMPVKWGNIDNLNTFEWDLLIAYWNSETKLLFIHASNTGSYYREFAAAVIEAPRLVRGAEMFRCFAGINRLRLNNVGTRKPIGKIENYTMRVGSDIAQVISPAEIKRVIKANIFGVGFERGSKTSIGCSHNGRVWAFRENNINTWMDWCNCRLPVKLLDLKV